MFKFRKVASILASAAMLSSTVALAAATTYPAPFVQNGVADVAVVWGTTAAATDQVAVTDIVASLNTALSQQGGTHTTTTVTGEAYPLFSSGSKLYYNDPINTVRTGSITKSALPTVLADGQFDGSTNVDYQQTVLLGSSPRLKFQAQPKSNVDPVLGYELSTTSGNYLYRMSVTFDEAINFTNPDNQGQTLELFGKEFTVSADTTTSSLVLLKSAESIDLDSDNPTKTVTVGGEQYTIELRSASDTSATIKVTNSAGTSQTKEVTEDSGTKTIAGLTVAVTDADETNFKLSATIAVGADEITFQDGEAVTQNVEGDDEEIDGTVVGFNGGTPDALTKLTIDIFAPASDEDALLIGSDFVDPVFGTLKIDFPSMSIGDNSTDREIISVENDGNDLMSVTLTDHNGKTVTQDFAYNSSSQMYLNGDDDGHNITVKEEGNTYIDSWVVVPGAEGKGHFLQLTAISNATSGFSNDKVTFKNVFTDDSQDALIDAEGSGTLSIEGDDYHVYYYGAHGASDTEKYAKVNFDRGSTSANDMILFPTLSTEKGALIALYDPQLDVSLADWNGRGTTLTKIKIPTGDQDTYFDVDFVRDVEGGYTVEGTTVNATTAYDNKTVSIGQLNFDFGWSGANQTDVYLLDPSTGARITQPAVIIWEGQDQADHNEALIVTLEAGNSADDGIGVARISRSWDDSSTMQRLDSDDNVYKAWDYWGSILTLDKSNDDQYSAEISYPEEQVNALVYIAEASATIGGDGGELGNPIFKDTETTAFQGKNLIVVGGSYVNAVAAKLLGSDVPLGGTDWTAKTGSEAGSFIIQTFESPYTTSKIATLVAGYNAGDTTNAATFFRTQPVDTSVGKKYLGTTETQATLQTS